MRPRLGCWLSSLCVLFLASLAHAKVEVQASQHSRMGSLLAVKISEDIAPGDYETLLRGVRDNPGQFDKKIVLLDSIGGSVAEAMRMGRLLRETGFDVLVPQQGLCQGSCIYLLAAGKQRTVRGAVAIHRPHYHTGESHQAKSVRLNSQPASYLQMMGVSPNLLRDMQQIEPQRPRLLTHTDLKLYRLL